MNQGDIEMGKVSQGTDKRRDGGSGLSSKKQITPVVAVLAKGSVNEVRLSSSTLIPIEANMPRVAFANPRSYDYAPGDCHPRRCSRGHVCSEAFFRGY